MMNEWYKNWSQNDSGQRKKKKKKAINENGHNACHPHGS